MTCVYTPSKCSKIIKCEFVITFFMKDPSLNSRESNDLFQIKTFWSYEYKLHTNTKIIGYVDNTFPIQQYD